jgi:hypothetical protein
MDFNDLLARHGIDAKGVVLLRHRPEPSLRQVLPWLAADKPDLFNAYQQVQSEVVERSFLKATHVASFIGHEPGKALFVGCYAVGDAERIAVRDFWHVPAHAELRALGMRGPPDTRESLLKFSLELLPFYEHWKGRLVIGWAPPERSWCRRAHSSKNAGKFPVLAVLEESLLVENTPKWDQVNLTWDQLHSLPSNWRAAFAEWRGVYFIFDASDGKGYVGSAGGADNLLGRWLTYAKSGHGGNRLLKGRDPRNFRFTILQLLARDAEAETLAAESNWKKRLHTRQPYGLNDN